jgi:hypothetical protein
MFHQILDLAEDLNEQLVGQINTPFAILRDTATCSATGANSVTRVKKTGFPGVHGH